MGIYINPTTDTTSRSKLKTIMELGKRINQVDFLTHVPSAANGYGIAIADNGFIAAGVAYDRAEAWRFVDGAFPIAYVLLTLDQIKSLDPSTGEVLEKYYANPAS